MFKKIASVFLSLIVAFALTAGTAMAAPQYDGSMKQDLAVMLIDADSGRVLFEQNADKQIRPASTTKILTTLLTLEESSLDDTVTIGPEGDWSDKSKGYSKLGTRKGETMSMKDLLYGMMIISGDDAADAIAVHVAGSMNSFVGKMNEKAGELGMTSSHFANAGGVDNDDHYVTARDMSKLALAAMRNPQFMDIVSKQSYDIPKTNKNAAKTIENTNLLLDSESEFYYQYADGIKTGSTPKAGDCLISSATKDGMHLVCLFFGQKYTDDRWKVSKDLFEWGFNNFKTIDAAQFITSTAPVEAQVEGCASDDPAAGMLQFKKPEVSGVYVTLDNEAAEALEGGADSIEAVPALSGPLKAPVNEGDVLGTVAYKLKSTGETVYTCDLIASRSVLAQSSPEQTATPTQASSPAVKPSGSGADNGNGGSAVILIIAGAAVVIAAFLIILLLKAKQRQAKKRRRQRYSYKRK